MLLKTSLVIYVFLLIQFGDCNSKKNVLFIAIDDLRTELGTYGQSMIKSPNIDELASKSMVFERAYCQVAVCSPSRASLLTGRRPDTNHVWVIAGDEYWRTYTNATTIPQYFKENGYISIGMGKIFHPGAPSGNDDVKYSWSPEGLPYYHSPVEDKYTKINESWRSYEGYADNQLPDGQIADRAIQYLKDLKENQTQGDQRPFFLAVGFHKPHLPFVAPSKYYDMYPPLSEIKLAENPHVPEGLPPIAYSNWLGQRFKDLEEVYGKSIKDCEDKVEDAMYSSECSIPDDTARKLRRAYYSCISYTDAQVGKVIKQLETEGFADDTVIILWADHGWQLGEHNIWAKFTNFEDATRVPFMIRVPGLTDNGMRTKALVELIDVFPSLAELAGIDVPAMCPENDKHDLLSCVEGYSIVPLLKDSNQDWKKAAFSQFARPYTGLPQIPGHKPFDKKEHGENVMGYTVRVDDYRFTEWYRFNRTTGVANFSEIWGTELYNHTQPTVFFNDENVNLANKTEMKSTVEELRKILQSGWRAATP